MKQFHLFLAILFCTFIVPDVAMACDHAIDQEVEMEMHCSMNGQKSCCSNDQDSKTEDKSCSSDCENSCCGCSATTTSSSAFTVVSEAIFENNATHYFSEKETQFSYVYKSTTSGFLSVWLIPKIG